MIQPAGTGAAWLRRRPPLLRGSGANRLITGKPSGFLDERFIRAVWEVAEGNPVGSMLLKG